MGGMSPENFIDLLEELVDLKIREHAEPHSMKMTAELGRMLHEKRVDDRNRIAQVKYELVRILSGR